MAHARKRCCELQPLPARPTFARRAWVHVLPEVLDLGRFRRAGERVRKPSRDWLFVGRVIENKCQHDLIEAFAVFASAFDPAARLSSWETCRSFLRRGLRHQVRAAGLEDRVVLWGKLSDEELSTGSLTPGLRQPERA